MKAKGVLFSGFTNIQKDINCRKSHTAFLMVPVCVRLRYYLGRRKSLKHERKEKFSTVAITARNKRLIRGLWVLVLRLMLPVQLCLHHPIRSYL